jgi:hypothetical protein
MPLRKRDVAVRFANDLQSFGHPPILFDYTPDILIIAV